ncbi:MAG: hypothetical protein LBH56_03705 [Coriobacteriales bacterium]|jgi:methyl-accepting chemotaxis protein|nr:hypothetical protein [Coriobacteriales bacterium]
MKNNALKSMRAPRIVLALLMVAALVPTVNLIGGFPATAHAEDSEQQMVAATASGPASVTAKEEVLYGLLNGDGTPRSSYVVNHFQINEPGTLTDYGAYRSVTNLTSTNALTLANEQVSGTVDKGDFYYEGIPSSLDLPWLINVRYTLDGASVEPSRLAGASGRLGIHITTQQNTKVDKIFFENYLLQIQMTLEASKVRNVNAPGATIATAGENRQVAFMVLPGREGDLTLEAQVTDFEMPGIQISALPFSMVFDIPDTADMLKDMETLTDAIGALDEGVERLKSGVGDMKGGIAGLASGSAGINDGLSLLSGNSTALRAASAQINGALATIAQQLGSGAVDPAQIDQLIAGLRQLAAGLYSGDFSQPGLAEGLEQVGGGISSAVGAMDGYITALAPLYNQGALGDLMTDALANLNQDSLLTLQSLLNTNTQAIYAQGVWYGANGNDGIQASLYSIAAGLGQFAGNCRYLAGQLTTIADGLEAGLSGMGQLQTLIAYMGELSTNYTAFDGGLVSYMEGIDTLAANYKAFNSGLTQFASGVNDLYGGISDLREGTGMLYANVEDLPATMQKEIDSFLSDYQKDDFTPVSFVSADNKDVALVQFVLLTDAIKVPAAEAPPSPAPAEQSFWDRLLSLFS